MKIIAVLLLTIVGVLLFSVLISADWGSYGCGLTGPYCTGTSFCQGEYMEVVGICEGLCYCWFGHIFNLRFKQCGAVVCWYSM
jgi:hypothetical protein